jgi:hypothetical protein
MNSRNGQEVTARRARGFVGNSKWGPLGAAKEFRSPALKPRPKIEVPSKNSRRENSFIGGLSIPRCGELTPARQVVPDCSNTTENLTYGSARSKQRHVGDAGSAVTVVSDRASVLRDYRYNIRRSV